MPLGAAGRRHHPVPRLREAYSRWRELGATIRWPLTIRIGLAGASSTAPSEAMRLSATYPEFGLSQKMQPLPKTLVADVSNG